MKMHVLNKLAGGPAGVAEYIITVRIHSGSDGLCDFAQARANTAQKLNRTIVQSREVLLGDKQGVTVANRTDVQKSKNQLVFVNPGNRDMAGYNFAKNTVAGTHSANTP